METPTEKVLPKNPTSTHSYDGKLEKSKAELILEISRVGGAPKGAKLECFARLWEALSRTEHVTPQADKAFQILVQTFHQDGHSPRGNNYDPSNDLYVDDLLFLCFEKVVIDDNKDLADALVLQLHDMASGMCAQGRTTRLFQILLAYS